MNEKPTECQCDGHGYCKLLKRPFDPPEGRKMSEVRWEECKNKPHYFEMFYNESENGNNPVKSRGFGDTVAKVLEKVGIKKKEGCGCEKRQEKLNQWFPYKQEDE